MDPKPTDDNKSQFSRWEMFRLCAAALLGGGAVAAGVYAAYKNHNVSDVEAISLPDWYRSSNNNSPNKIYIIDLENMHSHTKDLSDPNAVYLGFIGLNHHDVERYSDWKKCTSDNFVTEFSASHPKLLYIVEGRGKDLVDDKITELVPEIVEYIECCCSPTSTVFLVSKDHSMHTDTEWKLRKHLDKKGLTSIKIMWIPDQPFLSKSLDK